MFKSYIITIIFNIFTLISFIYIFLHKIFINFYADEPAYHQMPEAVSPLAATRAKQRVTRQEKCSRAWQRQQHGKPDVSILRRCQAAVTTDDININENRNDNENSTVKYSKDTTDNMHSNTEGAVAAANDDVEICEKLHWLEKVYALNRKIQQEEEIMLKLHAKIRKHQVRKAYQTKDEVLQQIDALDLTLAMQGADLKKVENTLAASNEQLKEKLCILEKLSQDFLQQSNVITQHNNNHTNTKDKSNMNDVVAATNSVSNTSNISTNVILSKTSSPSFPLENSTANTHTVVSKKTEIITALIQHGNQDDAASIMHQQNAQNVLFDNITSTDLSQTKHINKLMFDEQLLKQTNKIIISSNPNTNAAAVLLKQPQLESAANALPVNASVKIHQHDITQLGTLV